MRELYGDEVLELLKLADLLQHPEAYGCTIDRGDRPEVGQIIDTGAAILMELKDRARIW
jgi:hypothetical protein